MDETQFLLRVIAGLAAVATIAVVVRTVCAVGLVRSARRLEERANEFFDTWEPLAAQARVAVTDFAEQSGELLSRLNALSALLHKQALQADSLIKSVATSADENIDEVRAGVQRTLDRIDAASEALERSVTAPVTQLRAMAAGIMAAVREFTAGRRASPDRISTDEEMFI